jgi:tetratricopeptide (TPR) repeat protein
MVRSKGRTSRRERKPLTIWTLVKFTVWFLGVMFAIDWIFYGRAPWEPVPSSRPGGGAARTTTTSPPSAIAPAPAPIPAERNRGSTPAADPDRERIERLPDLNATTATPELLEEAKGLARRNPEYPWLQEYAASLHLWIGSRLIEERRYEDAERLLEEAESWGAARAEVAPFKAIVYREQRAWDKAALSAREALQGGSNIYPAVMHHILGKAHYFRQELSRAIEEYELSLSIQESAGVRADLEQARRDMASSRGSSRRVAHFIVTYEGETMEDIGRSAIDVLERSHASLVSQLGFTPSEPVGVVLYTRLSYRDYDGPHWKAGKYDGKIRVPVRDIRWGDDYVLRTLSHELAHAFFHSRTRGHDPRWLNEGLAEYIVGVRTRDVVSKLDAHLKEGGTLEWCLLNARYDCKVFYPAAASLVDYLVEIRGMGGIRDLLEDLADSRDITRSLRAVAGEDERSLIEDWERYVRRR